MPASITSRRQQEIITELRYASRYFQRLSTEMDHDQACQLPDAYWQTALTIHESILRLQLRLESYIRMAKQAGPQQSMDAHSSKHIVHSKST